MRDTHLCVGRETEKHLKALIWREVLAGFAEGERELPDLAERVKTACARAGFEYGSGPRGELLHRQLELAVRRARVRAGQVI